MGDLSDLPNFSKRPWFRRNNGARALIITMALLVGAAAWCLSAEDPAQDIEILASVQEPHAMIGAPFAMQTVIKNAGTRTAQIQVQAALYMKQGACMETGKRLPNSFSLPMTLSVAPNGSQTITMQFEAIQSACDGTLGVEIFADGKMDLDRFSLRRKLDAPTITLL